MKINIKTKFMLFVSIVISLIYIDVALFEKKPVLQFLLFLCIAGIGEYIVSKFIYGPVDELTVLLKESENKLLLPDVKIKRVTYDKFQRLVDVLNDIFVKYQVADTFKSEQLVILSSQYYSINSVSDMIDIVKKNHIVTEDDKSSCYLSLCNIIESTRKDVYIRLQGQIPLWIINIAMNVDIDLIDEINVTLRDVVYSDLDISQRIRRIKLAHKIYSNNFIEIFQNSVKNHLEFMNNN